MAHPQNHDNSGMKEQAENPRAAHDDNEATGGGGGNMGAGKSGKENMGSEKPSDDEGMGSQKPDHS